MKSSDAEVAVFFGIWLVFAWLISACRKQGTWRHRLLRVTPIDMIKSLVAMFFYRPNDGTGPSADGWVFPIDHQPPARRPRGEDPCPCGSGKRYRNCCRPPRRRR